MHRFYTIAGIPCVGFSPVSIMTEDGGEYLTVIEIVKATTGRRIVLLKKSDDYTLKLLNPSDIINEPTDFIVDIAKWLLVYDHIEFAKWAHAKGCPWYNNVIRYAINNSNLEFAEWARANGCPEN
jgi:hypothetical protein